MNMQDILLIIISTLSLFYSIFFFIRGRKIKITFKTYNIFSLIFYFLLAILILIKDFSTFGIISACIVIISGILYSIIPSGYNEKGIYINGRLFSFRRIGDMEFDYVNGYYQLSFSFRGKYHVLTCKPDEKNKLKAALELYKNQKRSIDE